MDIIYILDSSALFSVQQVLTFYSPTTTESTSLFYTPPDIIAELKDQMSKLRIESMIASQTLLVKDTEQNYSIIVGQYCHEIGNTSRLSSPDKAVLSLALQEKEKNPESTVIVLTDDFEIQNTAKRMNIKFKPIRTKGIKYSAQFKRVCQACGENLLDDEESCPECGSTKILKKKRKIYSKK